jgi:hypothetical protein
VILSIFRQKVKINQSLYKGVDKILSRDYLYGNFS